MHFEKIHCSTHSAGISIASQSICSVFKRGSQTQLPSSSRRRSLPGKVAIRCVSGSVAWYHQQLLFNSKNSDALFYFHNAVRTSITSSHSETELALAEKKSTLPAHQEQPLRTYCLPTRLIACKYLLQCQQLCVNICEKLHSPLPVTGLAMKPFILRFMHICNCHIGV